MTTIGVVEKSRGAYWDRMNLGLRTAANRRGFTVRVSAPEYVNIEQQHQLMRQQLDQGVDALVFVATHPDAFTDVVVDALDSGIPVITIDIDGYQDKRLFHVGTSPFVELGRQAAEEFLARRTHDGPILAQAGSTAPGAVGKLEGFVDRVTGAGLEVVVTEPDYERVEQAMAAARAFLAEHPRPGGMYGVYAHHPSVQAQVAREVGLSPGEVPIVGFDMLDQTVADLRDGWVSASLWVREYHFGLLGGTVGDLFATLPWGEAMELLGGSMDHREQNRRRLAVTCFDATNVASFEAWQREHGDVSE